MQRLLVAAASAVAVLTVGFIPAAEAGQKPHHHKVICKIGKKCHGHGRHRHCRIVRVCKKVHHHR